MTEPEEQHKFARWFGIPVCVQLRQPYIVPEDQGPQEVPFEDGKKKVFGTPVVVIQEKGNNVMGALSGDLQPDGPDRLILFAQIEGLGLVRVGLTPTMIDYITAIAEREEKRRIVEPSGSGIRA